MIKIGMMIGDRYEILEKIGTGGMSDVYKAKDHKLNRFVAMKVLKQEFSENANFVSKFRIEAQAAAGLMHSNIVNVYDVGEENGIYYIVMELVEGITLKKYIEKKARLTYKEAVSIAIQVSMGIEAAHNNHIIHRDIKPQNIIISKDGKVKVTDFGIAKAATSNTITSNVMGSVHYTSPEQARGGYSDEKSDIYSLGVTMFEMLTGRVPFNGETTVAIAIKHIQEEMPSPAEYVPEIPSSVESIVLKCCQKSPDRRYQTIQELTADLKQSLMNPDEDFVVQNDPDMDGGTRMITDSDMAQIKRRATYQEYEEQEPMRLRSEAEAEYDDMEDVEDEDDYDYNPKAERVATLLAVLGGIVICGIVIFLAVRFLSGRGGDQPDLPDIINTEDPESTSPEPVETVPVPNVMGWMVEDARNALNAVGLIPEIRYEESDTVDMSVIMGSNVDMGTEVPVGSTVILTASAGPSGVEVPSVTGYTYEEAKQRMEAQGFVVERMEAYSDTVAANYVASQSLTAGSRAPSGTTVTLTVSLGPVQTQKRVPYLIGKSEADGTIELIEQGLAVGNVDREHNSAYAAGQIFYQSYSEGTMLDAGTKVDLKVSLGPEPVQTPEPVTYRCNMSISAPTVDETEGKYTTGTIVTVRIVSDDGTELLNTATSNFPVSVNYGGIKSSGGTLTMTFSVEEPVTTIDPETGNEVATTTSRQITVERRVEFERE